MRTTHAGPWQLGMSLGKRVSGRARKVRHVSTGLEGTIRIIRPRKVVALSNVGTRSPLTPALAAESLRLQLTVEQHPHIVRMYDVWANDLDMYVIVPQI